MAAQAELGRDVDEQAEVDAVALHERHRLQHLPPAAVLARQRLDDAAEVGVQQRDERAGRPAPCCGRRRRPCRRWAGRRSPSRSRPRARVSSGPSRPMTKREPKLVMSASHHTTRSPWAALRPFHMASPLPVPGPTSASRSADRSTRAPAARGHGGGLVGRAVVDDQDLVDQRDPLRPAGGAPSPTMAPTVAASSLAGRHSVTTWSPLGLDAGPGVRNSRWWKTRLGPNIRSSLVTGFGARQGPCLERPERRYPPGHARDRPDPHDPPPHGRREAPPSRSRAPRSVRSSATSTPPIPASGTGCSTTRARCAAS